jgi:hypothetical protein
VRYCWFKIYDCRLILAPDKNELGVRQKAKGIRAATLE